MNFHQRRFSLSNIREISPVILLICILFLNSLAVSQDKTGYSKLVKMPVRYLSMFKHDGINLSNGFGFKAVNWRNAALAGSVIASATLFEEQINKNLRRDKKDCSEKLFDTFEPLGNIKLLYYASGTMLLGSTLLRKEKMADMSFTLLEGLFITGVTVKSLKYLIGRARPIETYSNSEFKPAKKIHSSLPSGHTATAFTAAAILSEYYPDMSTFYYTLAGSVGIQRVLADKHWLSDVMFGGIIGYLNGKFVARSHLRLFPFINSNSATGLSFSFKL